MNRVKPGSILINKTHLRNNNQPLSIPDYDCLHSNPNNRRNGESAIYIHKQIIYTTINVNTTTMETVAIKIGNMMLVNGYRVPGSILNIQDLENIFEEDQVILTSDLNASSTSWNSATINNAGRALERFALNHDLSIYDPDEPTHIPFDPTKNPTTIDIIISKNIPVSHVESLIENSSQSCHIRNKKHYPNRRGERKNQKGLWMRPN